MSKNTGTSELINYFDLGANGDVGIAGSLDINTIANATTDTDTFLVSDTGIIKYRTGAQLLSDIGAQGALTNPVTGTGTTNYLPKFTGSTTIGNSVIQEASSNIGIGVGPSFPLDLLTSSAGTFNTIAQFYNNNFTAGNRSYLRVRQQVNAGASSSSYFGTGQDGNLYIIANDSARGGDLVINAGSGNLLVGTTSDNGARLQVSGTGNFSGSIQAATESNIVGTSVNARLLVTASGVANTVVGFNNSGSTTTGVTNNTAYLGVLQAYPLVFTTDSVERLRIASTGAATFSSTITTTGANINGDVLITNASNAQIGFNTTGAVNSAGAYLYFNRSGSNKWTAGMGPYTGSDNYEIATGSVVALSLAVTTGAAIFSSTVRINADGQSLLIFPTTTNSVRMQIQSTGGGNLVLGTENSTGSNLATGTNAYASVFTSGSTKDLVLGTNSIARLTINGSSGNVGIGVISANAKLQVDGTIYSNVRSNTIDTDDGISNNLQGYGGYWALRTDNSNNFNLDVYGNGTPKNALFISQVTGRVGIRNTDPQGLLEVGVVNNNTTQGGHFFSTFLVTEGVWTTVFTAPSNLQWNAVTEFTWVSSADFNRSGAAYMRWAYDAGSANLGVVYTLFNNSQNATGSFRRSGNEIQILITGGGGVNYYVQVRIQGSKAA